MKYKVYHMDHHLESGYRACNKYIMSASELYRFIKDAKLNGYSLDSSDPVFDIVFSRLDLFNSRYIAVRKLYEDKGIANTK